MVIFKANRLVGLMPLKLVLIEVLEVVVVEIIVVVVVVEIWIVVSEESALIKIVIKSKCGACNKRKQQQ